MTIECFMYRVFLCISPLLFHRCVLNQGTKYFDIFFGIFKIVIDMFPGKVEWMGLTSASFKCFKE